MRLPVSFLALAVVLGLAAFLTTAATPATAAPVAAAVATLAAAPLTVTLDASGSTVDPGRTIASVTWDPGDGSTAQGATVAHVYAAPGTYHATVVVIDDAGETSTAAVDVVVPGVTLVVPRPHVVVGGTVAVAGSAVPAAADLEIAIEQRRGGDWVRIASDRTNPDGNFHLRVAPTAGGPVRAVVVSSALASPPVELDVVPAVSLRAGTGTAFVGATVTASVRPSRYTGRATLTVSRGGRDVGTATGRVVNGVLRATVPMPGTGTFAVHVDLPAVNGFGARGADIAVHATARTVGPGAQGADVAALVRRLAELGYHTPGPTASFGSEVFDVVTAFQKAEGLPRTGVAGPETWARLGTATTPRPRYASPATHIEIDKTRQILIKVVGGQVAGIIPVSTGATGNTPEGHWHVLWKAPATSTWLGSAILYRTLTFHGNFAIHGYPSVPAYPASHGCTREPIWAADWLYEITPVGEDVYVYD